MISQVCCYLVLKTQELSKDLRVNVRGRIGWLGALSYRALDDVIAQDLRGPLLARLIDAEHAEINDALHGQDFPGDGAAVRLIQEDVIDILLAAPENGGLYHAVPLAAERKGDKILLQAAAGDDGGVFKGQHLVGASYLDNRTQSNLLLSAWPDGQPVYCCNRCVCPGQDNGNTARCSVFHAERAFFRDG